MVRYHEIVNETDVSDQIALCNEFYLNGQNFSKAEIVDNHDGSVTIDSYVCWLHDSYSEPTLPKVNIKMCLHSFECQAHKLTSLKYIPKFIPGDLVCHNNPLKSLEGIESDSVIEQDLYVTYTPTLPLLRTLRVKNEILFQDQGFTASGGPVDIIRKILNSHNKNSNFKKALIDCQYDLIKAGFKDNAKW
jgi:hypothetical protein